MKMLKITLVMLFLIHVCKILAQSRIEKEGKMNILNHGTSGPENPTRAALAFLMAKAAVEEGHTTTLFLAGDAVQLFRSDVLNNLSGLCTGNLREHYDAIMKDGGRFYLSGVSSKSRSILESDLNYKPAEFAMRKYCYN